MYDAIARLLLKILPDAIVDGIHTKRQADLDRMKAAAAEDERREAARGGREP
jgi:hypothetical protein